MHTTGASGPPGCVTAEMTVRFRRPTPTGDPVRLRAWPVSVDGTRVVVDAELLSGGIVTATCHATFVAVGPDHPAYQRWQARHDVRSSMFDRFFRKGDAPAAPAPAAPAAAPAPTSAGDTATVRRIVGKLEAMPPEQARLIASAAYILARAANADLVISDDETARHGGGPAAQRRPR